MHQLISSSFDAIPEYYRQLHSVINMEQYQKIIIDIFQLNISNEALAQTQFMLKSRKNK